MDNFKFIILALTIFIVPLMIGYAIGFMDSAEIAKENVGEIMLEECHLPKSGGMCKTYCSVGDKDLYELNVEYKKVEVE